MQRCHRPFEIFKILNASVCIWLNGEPTAIGRRAERLWNRAKYRVAADGAINEISKRQAEARWPDVVCGDFDSLNPEIDMKNAKLVHLPDQDHTDLSKAVNWCLEQKTRKEWSFEQIVILGGLSGRFDHTMSTLSTILSFVENPTPLIVLDSTNLVIAIAQGSSLIELDLENTTKMCGVIPLAQKKTLVTSKGLKYEMAELPLEFGKLISTSNEITTNQVLLKSTAPVIFTIELKAEG